MLKALLGVFYQAVLTLGRAVKVGPANQVVSEVEVK